MANPALPPDTLDRDSLTGFLTRPAAHQLVKEIETHQGVAAISLLSVEISRFGSVNSGLGSSHGDKIISLVAKRLKKMFPHAVGIARMHGDHFCLIFTGADEVESAIADILDFAQRPLAVRGEVIVLSVRVGVADHKCGLETGAELMHASEVALHHSKSERAKVAYFDAAMVADAKAMHNLENDLRVSLITNGSELHRAINNSEFRLVYQPIVSAKTGTVHAFEALLRWHHPTRGIVSPALFIPLAEQITVMDVLGAWVIRKACADAMEWEANPDGSLPAVSINVSPTQFLKGSRLIKTVEQAIQETGIDPQRIKLEITETADLEEKLDPYLDSLRALGCKISLDDFGTGYASIARLTDLPIDYLKIDRSFVVDLCSEDLKKGARAERIASAVLALGASLGLTSIVEGVEDEAQIDLVKKLGGDLIQGYVYSKPLEPDAVNTYIARR